MRALAPLVCLAIIGATLVTDPASAQSLPTGCAAQQTPTGNQSLRCRTGLAIVAENGATFTLHQDTSGEVDAVDLQNKALLLEAPKQRGKARFQVTTPQAIAAVRGTKWAVDAQNMKTSVLVLIGRVAVRRRSGSGRVFLGPGEGVDVEDGTDPLVVKRWPQARVDALLARLAQ
jgi:ferric-dicitrate binding protein FerR (iron transport regulator)